MRSRRDYYIGTGGNVTWTWLLFGPIDVRVTGARLVMDYRGALTGSDINTSYSGVGFRFKQGPVARTSPWSAAIQNSPTARFAISAFSSA
jgi:hypothetical protein